MAYVLLRTSLIGQRGVVADHTVTHPLSQDIKEKEAADARENVVDATADQRHQQIEHRYETIEQAPPGSQGARISSEELSRAEERVEYQSHA